MTAWASRVAALFAAHRSRLEGLVRRQVRDRDAAAELVQEAFARVLKAGSAGSLEDDTRVLYAVARNAAIDYGLQSTRRARALAALAPEQMHRPPPTAEQHVAARESLGVLDAALEELSERTQAVFILRRVDGLTNAAVARRLNISVSAVEKHLARALRHCQSRLAEDVDETLEN